MNLSLNEVEGVAKKAARGAGYSWGLSEEAAKATRWLCSAGLDGCAALAGLLNEVDNNALSPSIQISDNGQWSAGNGWLCPIISGSSLSDHSQLIGHGEQITLVSVVSPALVLPFGYLISRELQEAIQVTWSDGNAVFDGTSLSITGKAPIGGEDLTVAKGGSMGSTQETQTRAAPDPKDWDILQRFAARTYAPATEESRQKGAGDGSTRDD